jgi:hypothetical protein
LFNEYVAGRFGELIGVPFGSHALVEVGDDLHPPDGEPTIPHRLPGSQAGTVYFRHQQDDLNGLPKVLNWSSFPAVLVFDTFIARRDWRAHGIYPSSGSENGERDMGFIFDQGSAFTGKPDWSDLTLSCQPDCSDLDDKLDELRLKFSFPELVDYEPFLSAVEALTKDQIEAVVNEAPLDEWTVSPSEAGALITWLDRRKTLVRSAIKRHLGR